MGFLHSPRFSDVERSLPGISQAAESAGLGSELRALTEMLSRRELSLEDYLAGLSTGGGGGGGGYTPKSDLWLMDGMNIGAFPLLPNASYGNPTWDFVQGEGITVPSVPYGVAVVDAGTYMVMLEVFWGFSGSGFRRAYISMGTVTGPGGAGPTYSGFPYGSSIQPGMAAGVSGADTEQVMDLVAFGTCAAGDGILTVLGQNSGGDLTVTGLLKVTRIA